MESSYNSNNTTKSPSICMIAYNITYLTVLLPQSRDCSCYVKQTNVLPPAPPRF